MKSRHLTLLLSAITLAAPTVGLAVPTDFILETAPGITAGDIARDYHIALTDVAPGRCPFALFTADSSELESLEAQFALDPRVIFSEVDSEVALAEPDTTSRGGTIPVIGSIDRLDQENANLLVQIGYNVSVRNRVMRRLRVGVLDTGLSPLATTLWARCVRYQDQFFSPTGQYDLPDPLFPLDSIQNQSVGHGTMVSGLIQELAPNADLVIERVADSTGRATSWSIIRGLADAVDSKASIVNISMGAIGPIVAFEEAFAWARQRGTIVVAPAGNDNLNTLLEPAAFDGVVAVAGVDASDVKAPFSNWDSNVEACAPAIGIRSINWDGQMAIWSGTSFSAPLVTGGLSLAVGVGKSITNANVNEFLDKGGDSVNTLNPLYKGQLGKRLNVTKLLLVSTPSTARRP